MPTATSTTNAVVLDALGRYPGATAAELAQATGIGRSTVGKALARLEEQGKAQRTPGGRDGAWRMADRWAEARPLRTEQPPPGARTRLAKGELQTMVLDWLRARPGEELTPTAVARALGRSAGAVSNALARLAKAGDVLQTSPAPRTYSAR